MADLLSGLEESGFGAIVLTVDQPTFHGYREQGPHEGLVADLLAAKGDAGLNEGVNDGSSQLVRLVDFAYRVIEHSGEHYGQLVAYYRINGMVPPESREK